MASIAQVALDRALHRAGTREQITGIWNQLTRQIPGQSPTACLESMLAAAWRGRGTRANDLLLFWVAFDLMPAVDEIDIRRGKLRSPQLQNLCLNVARHCQTERLASHQAAQNTPKRDPERPLGGYPLRDPNATDDEGI